MTDFTQTWNGLQDNADLLQEFVGKPDLRFIEVGCYEGRTTLWLLENVLTHSSAQITVVDVFAPTQEFADLGIRPASLQVFHDNTAGYEHKILLMCGESRWTLRLIDEPEFDFAYIDGSHRAADVLSDAVLTWPLLKPQGILVFDDYGWGEGRDIHDRPQPAIDAFLNIHSDQLTMLRKDYQVAIRKN